MNPFLEWRRANNPRDYKLTDVIAGIPDRFEAGIHRMSQPRLLAHDLALAVHRVWRFLGF